VTGRLSDVIITGGENVQPADVERVLRTVQGVSDACVFGLPDTRWGEIVCAALVADPNRNDALEEIRVACAASLAPFTRPRKYCFVENIPATHSGKPDRIALLKVASPLLRSLTYPASAL
jgi:O-succinylbenzoic acid--CoA ligase